LNNFISYGLLLIVISKTEGSNKIATNGHGLAMWWNLKIFRLELRPNKNTKDEAKKQKPNRITSAETAADSDNAEANNVQPPYCQTTCCVLGLFSMPLD
jgi:hypothetical protein